MTGIDQDPLPRHPECGGPLGERAWDPHVYARWRRYKDFSTGIIGDLLVHEMTPLFFALDLDWPSRVDAIGGHYIDKAMENHDQVNIEVQFEKGHTMIVAGSTCNEQGLETMIRGHEGNIFLNGAHCEMRPERLFADEIDEGSAPKFSLSIVTIPEIADSPVANSAKTSSLRIGFMIPVR